MATFYFIPKDLSAMEALGGETSADEWYESRSGNPSVIQGCGKGNAVTISFATSGTLTDPVFGADIGLGVNATNFSASLLLAGINAGFMKDDNHVILVKVTGSGTENFYASINNNNLNFWPPATV